METWPHCFTPVGEQYTTTGAHVEESFAPHGSKEANGGTWSQQHVKSTPYPVTYLISTKLCCLWFLPFPIIATGQHPSLWESSKTRTITVVMNQSPS